MILMKSIIISVLASLLLFVGCKTEKKAPKLSEAEIAKQKEVRLGVTAEFYLKSYLALGGAALRPGDKTFQEAKKLVLKTEVPVLLLKQHKCESTAPEYDAIKKCVFTTIQDNSVFPAFFKASTALLGELQKHNLVSIPRYK